jgi:predicted O-methyltransferase YrrM
MHQIKHYLNHWLDAVDEHSIHSPFFFDFYKQVIKKDPDDTRFHEVEELRKKLLINKSELKIKDLGAQSSHFSNGTRTISQVAATSLCPAKYGRLLLRIIEQQRAKEVLELGTSMGLTSLYLGLNPNTHVTTFEGNPALINIALTHFESFEKKNIDLVEGNIDYTLPQFILQSAKIDFVFMDANHRYEPTLQYFKLLTKRMAPGGIIVLDDIYHSPEMTRAWQELRKHQLVYGSIDLFRMGILFFDPALNRQHYTWSY